MSFETGGGSAMETLVGIVVLGLMGYAAYWLFFKRSPEATKRQGRGADDDLDGPAEPVATADAVGRIREVELPPVPQDAPPAVDPVQIPDTVEHGEGARARPGLAAYPQLRRVLSVLDGWEPKWHTSEKKYHDSLLRHFLGNGYAEDEVAHQARVRPKGAERYVKPDFIVGLSQSEIVVDGARPRSRERGVLVEVKLGLTGMYATHQAVGQIYNYLETWRPYGASVLLVCDEYSDELREVIRQRVRRWKELGLPVMAYFVRAPERFSDVPSNDGG
jgi:hypothetical protein